MKRFFALLLFITATAHAQTFTTPQVNSDWNASSTVAQILNKPSLAAVATSGAYIDLSGKPSLSTVATTGNFADLLSKPTTLAGYGITDGVSSASLATTLSGYATTSALSAGLNTKFAIPTGTTSQYVRGDGTLATLPASSTGTVTSIIAGTGLNGGTITTSGTLSLVPRSFGYTTRALNTCYQISATRDAMVNYGVDVTTILTLTQGQTGTVTLCTYTDSACTTGGQTVTSGTSGLPTALSVTVGLSNLGTVVLPGVIPAGSYVRLETMNTACTPAFSARAAQEVLL